MSTLNYTYPTTAPTVRHVNTITMGPLPLAPLKLSQSDFEQLAAWLVEYTAVHTHAVPCRWDKSCGKILNLSGPRALADLIQHLNYNHPDGSLRSGNYRHLSCKWAGCGACPCTFTNSAHAEEWIYRHVLEHSGVCAAKEGRKIERCALCKRSVDGFQPRGEHMRRCIAKTPFLDTAMDLETYGVRVCGFDKDGVWTQVRVKETGDQVWVKDAKGRWIDPRTGMAAFL
ncbi:unnamed protein product [Peniophora sp. CBMAI 1063]|nr:unnamed protein product [Peniophora sp. CBMAI 1063]